MTEPFHVDGEPGCGAEEIDARLYEVALAPMFTRVYTPDPPLQSRFPWSRASGGNFTDYEREWEAPNEH